MVVRHKSPYVTVVDVLHDPTAHVCMSPVVQADGGANVETGTMTTKCASDPGKPLDLLPDRTAEAVMPWLASQPEIQVVSRDRASAYADAVSRILPHATQVADRYHLQQFLDRKRTCLPEVEDIPLKEGPPPTRASEIQLLIRQASWRAVPKQPTHRLRKRASPRPRLGRSTEDNDGAGDGAFFLDLRGT